MTESEIIFSNDPFSEENPYEILGLDRDSDRAKIKSAYRALQRRARRGDEIWMKAQVANEALTKPKQRLLTDLFVVYEKGVHKEIIARFGEITFDLIPDDIAPLLLQVADLDWQQLEMDFSCPPVPKIVFRSMIPPASARGSHTVPISRFQ